MLGKNRGFIFAHLKHTLQHVFYLSVELGFIVCFLHFMHVCHAQHYSTLRNVHYWKRKRRRIYLTALSAVTTSGFPNDVRHFAKQNLLTVTGSNIFLHCTSHQVWLAGSVALLVARRTNDRKVAGSRPTKVVCITVLTGNRMG